MALPGPDYPAPAKLNLFLHVVGRRADGYHLLQSAFVLIDRADRLRFGIRKDGTVRRVNEVPGVPADDDLVIRAARALQAKCGTRLGADIEVEKRIPMGAGLGGGSSDAATTLRALNRLWSAGLDEDALGTLGLALGADVPFFLYGRPAWVEGIGERLRPLAWPAFWYAVLTPPVEVPTRGVFAAAELTRNTEPLKMEDFSAQSWGDRFRNDLEAVVVSRHPVVGEHLEWLARHGRARMTGSGSCVFAAFEHREAAQRVIDALPDGMRGFVARGLAEHPLHE
jgi:4-diphosphocytidyl-2-C-methyl-D-erythritol kinase